MKLEVGKYYRTRDEGKVGPLVGVNFKWVDNLLVDGCEWEWTNEGYGRLGAPDIIAEWADEPQHAGFGEHVGREFGAVQTGTLQELNVKPGDVVDWIDNPNCRSMSVIEVNALYEHPFVGMIQAEFSNYGRGIFDKEKFRVISRASTTPSPVRTVTRKELVAGSYGPITISDGAVQVDYWMPEDGIDKLSEIINALTAIKEAME